MTSLFFRRTYISMNVGYKSYLKNLQITCHEINFIRQTHKKIKFVNVRPVFKLQNFSVVNKLYQIIQQPRIVLREQLYKCTIENFRCFHTSERRYLHPALWVILKPVLKLFAVLSGRGFRKWWKNLPHNKRKYFMNVIIENRNKIIATALISILLFGFYYLNHLEETPVTKRKRFIAFNAKQLNKIHEYEFQQIIGNMQGQILPASHPYTLRVNHVVNRILNANHDITEVKQKKWGIAVIDSSIENAFVLPIGYVFVFTGMLKLCSNDDQLGIILSHEIAHCIQNHGAENISFTHLLDLISIIIIATIWAVLPSDSISLLTHWLYQKLTEILFQLPYNRKIETEADNVGLQLAAKACFDVRESSAFWSKMSILNKTTGKAPQIEFLSTHPNHETRSEYLDSIMDQAVKLRHDCGCPRLKQIDPRKEVEVVAKVLDITRKKYLEQYPKPVYAIYV